MKKGQSDKPADSIGSAVNDRRKTPIVLVVGGEAGARLFTAFAHVLPGGILPLPTFGAPVDGIAKSAGWRLCVGLELGRRIRLQGWRNGLIFAVSRAEFGSMFIGLGPHDALLFHDVPPARLVSAARLAINGMTVFPPGVIPAEITPGPQLSGFDRLGDEDRAVLTELTLGLSNSQIAARLGGPIERVRLSIDRIFRALGCRNRTEVAAFAYSQLTPFLDLPKALPPGERTYAAGSPLGRTASYGRDGTRFSTNRSRNPRPKTGI